MREITIIWFKIDLTFDFIDWFKQDRLCSTEAELRLFEGKERGQKNSLKPSQDLKIKGPMWNITKIEKLTGYNRINCLIRSR